MVKNLPAMQETWVWSLGQEYALEKGKATYFTILAWRISRTEELDRLQSMGSQRVGHDWAANTTTTSTWVFWGFITYIISSAYKHKNHNQYLFICKFDCVKDKYIHVVFKLEGNGTPLQYSCLEKSHGRRSLVGCHLWGRTESDTTEAT